ncbi:MAG TPA: hypothetical protein VFA12_06645 [Stellaceae bacterium]|nr:hypothetical protein [Stellaceae bacterium]
MSIMLRHPGTGQTKAMPEGWSWSCFFGSMCLGAPLFARGLFEWGAVMVVFNTTYLIVQFIPTDAAGTLENWMYVIGFGLCAFFGLKANAMALERHLNHGWEFADRRYELLHSGPMSHRHG